GPAAVVEPALPLGAPVVVGVLVGRRIAGGVGRKPVAQLVAERELVVGEGQVHGGSVLLMMGEHRLGAGAEHVLELAHVAARPQEVLDPLVVRVQEARLLGGEQLVEGRAADAGGADDVGDSGGGVALGGDDVRHRREQPGALGRGDVDRCHARVPYRYTGAFALRGARAAAGGGG